MDHTPGHRSGRIICVHALTFEHCYLVVFNLVTKWTEGILPHEDVLKIPEKENKVKVLVAQLCPTLPDSMDHNRSGSSV